MTDFLTGVLAALVIYWLLSRAFTPAPEEQPEPFLHDETPQPVGAADA